MLCSKICQYFSLNSFVNGIWHIQHRIHINFIDQHTQNQLIPIISRSLNHPIVHYYSRTIFPLRHRHEIKMGKKLRNLIFDDFSSWAEALEFRWKFIAFIILLANWSLAWKFFCFIRHINRVLSIFRNWNFLQWKLASSKFYHTQSHFLFGCWDWSYWLFACLVYFHPCFGPLFLQFIHSFGL